MALLWICLGSWGSFLVSLVSLLKVAFCVLGIMTCRARSLGLDCQGSEYTSVMQHVYQEKIAFHFFKDNTSKLAGPD